MDPESAMGIFILIATVVSLILDIIFYRLVFRNKKRMKANGNSYLVTLSIMAPICIGILFAFVPELTGGIGVAGAAFILVFIIAPIFWFVPTSFYTMIRAIYIASTKGREREILSKDIEEAEILGYELVDDESNL